MIKFYKVGGTVRDKYLGKTSKDVDMCVEAPSYNDMKEEIIRRGGEIFVEHSAYLTIRARMEPFGACDFVLCRKESHYTDGRRPENVGVGTLLDDLARRDFTMNAIAEDEDGNVIDPFNGVEDIKWQIIRAVGNPLDRLEEDRLRILRAIRFTITLGFRLDKWMHDTILFLEHQEKSDLFKGVSVERIREELLKCFQHNTMLSLGSLSYYNLMPILFRNNDLWLMPTLKK